MSLDPRPARPDLLTSREVSKILGGVLAGLSMTYGRTAVREALSADVITFGDYSCHVSGDAVPCARIIGATLAALCDLATIGTALTDGLMFWVDKPAAIDGLPDKEEDRGGN